MDFTLLILGLDVLLRVVDYTWIETHLQVNVIVGERCQELSLIDITGASNTFIS